MLKGLHDFGEKRIGDFGNDQSENAASSRYQGARLSIGVVAQFIHHFPDAFCQLRINRRDAVDGARDGGGGDFRSPGNLTNVHRNERGGATTGRW